MTAQASLQVTPTGESTWTTDPAGASPAGSTWPSSSQLRARVSRPHPDALVITVDGDVDAVTVEQLQQVLWPRLSATVGTLVVELTGVGFLGVAGLELLGRTHLGTRQRGIALGLVLAGGESERAVRMAGLDQDMPCFPTVEHAVSELDGRA